MCKFSRADDAVLSLQPQSSLFRFVFSEQALHGSSPQHSGQLLSTLMTSVSSVRFGNSHSTALVLGVFFTLQWSRGVRCKLLRVFAQAMGIEPFSGWI